MEELIKIRKSGKTGYPVVNARDLFVFLEVHQDFSTWLKKAIIKWNFVENVDFARLYYDVYGNLLKISDHKKMESDFQIHRIEYALTLNCAKELAMVQNNDKGKQARQYFLEVERKYMELKENKSILTYTMSDVAKRLNLTDYYGKIGRNALYNILYHHKIVNEKNQPLRKYVKKGYFTEKPHRVSEDGLKWLNQLFCVEKTGNGDLIKAISDLQNKYDALEKRVAISQEGVGLTVETLLYNKGGNHTEEKNRAIVGHMNNYLERFNNIPKALGQ
jgi:phage anti-repressor protein